ncbi:MAG TPA: Gfo/Idh/MocA family oxidoreductase [Spirochaetota bacterium]|nr:Gfo/Idh/MocA family oxidoreductase [Spirochaetota bacterium]HOD15394.1 Gfo/Idh/MocA family oxidoreductase [Spirochaetota bacterium]HPG51572.1 Gfo/Idh/MocA family oxidoreductase [Spirochaetota bacterium]HPN11248.1 Gfo/Idh/MocA family oxidoreductase [Spirochaetota bacterium]
MEKINVGFIGCGRISDLHYPGYKSAGEARVYAVCDADPDTAAARKRQWKAAKAYTDYRELLADPAVDAVEILTPHLAHEEQVIAAAAAGKHISLQKPMTVSLESASRMLGAVSGTGKTFKVSDNYVFYPPLVLARGMIRDGAIGAPTNLRIKFVSGTGGWKIPASSWEWRVKERAEGRPFQTFDHGHHLFAAAWFLMGEIEKISSWIDSRDGVIDCPALVQWKYRDGATYGTCDYSHAPSMNVPSKYYANDEWFEITGEKGIIMVRRCTGNINAGPSLSLFNGRSWKNYNPPSDWGAGFIGSTKNFIAAIRGREEPLLSGPQAYGILKIDLAVQRSSRLRRAVYTDEMERTFPALYAWRMRRREIANDPLAPKKAGGGSTARYAPQAAELTRGLMARYDAEAASGWDCVIGLHLTAEGDAAETLFGLYVRGGTAELKEGSLPDNPALVIRAGAGTWAAILLKKKRIEMALIQGKLKAEGKAEEGLKLRSVFHL